MVIDDKDEIERFKRLIDPRCYLTALGYEEDKRHSSRGSTCMRNPETDDKIFIKRDSKTGHYVYASVRDDRDNGTIIDLVQFRKNLSLGAVRKELRPWIGQPPIPVPIFPALVKTTKDRGAVEIEFARMTDALHHAWLEGERRLPAELLQSERFAGRVRVDARMNAIFPHFDSEGLCGYEIRNRRFKSFAKSGSKALWLSQERNDDNRLVFSESAIDSLSYAALFPDDRTRYASIGGKTNPQQPELIRAAVARMPNGSEIISAMDADAEGAKLAEVVRKAFELSGRADLRFVVQEPVGFKDWNDQLQGRQPSPALPAVRLSGLDAG